MKLSILAAIFSLAILPLTALAQTPDAHLNSVLAQLDAASEHFVNARADLSQDYYEAVVKDTTTETGSIYFERKGNGTQMGAFTVDARTGKKDKIFEYRDGLLRILEPGVDQIRIIKPSANSGQIESFLTLGFGGSGKALAQSWNITDQGSETLSDAGQPVKTEKLDLISKDANVRNTFTHITIWVDPTRGVSLKQIFETPSHDKRTTTYSHIKVNSKIDAAPFAIKAGPHTTTVGP